MEKWVVKAKKADFQKIGVDFHIDPVIARLIRNRDVIGYDAMEEYLYGDLKNLADVWQLKDIEKAVELLNTGIREKRRFGLSVIMISMGLWQHMSFCGVWNGQGPM